MMPQNLWSFDQEMDFNYSLDMKRDSFILRRQSIRSRGLVVPAFGTYSRYPYYHHSSHDDRMQRTVANDTFECLI